MYYTFLFFQALGLPQLCGLMALPAEVKVFCCTGYLFSHLLVLLRLLVIKKVVFILVFLFRHSQLNSVCTLKLRFDTQNSCQSSYLPGSLHKKIQSY